MGVDLVEIPAGGIRLPDLDELVAHRLTVTREDAAGDDDALALRLAVVLPRQIGIHGADRGLAVRGPGQLRQRRGEDHERLLRRPEAGTDVVVVVVRRIGADALGVAHLGERPLTDRHGSPSGRPRTGRW